MLSLGSPHSETFSAGLWGLIAISCGILGLIFILASAYALVCWRWRHRGQFAPLLNESDSVADAQVKT
ncbi:unnamed protein product [Dibothriocephalus latus]|uniref:Uncharacterized protein n=1 Tax=Dibothriocephalus latus TaxID=60516 RepID=A0A3P7NT99_DIBLA|nr:unnamed protein product [Dibothriocephalus latus]